MKTKSRKAKGRRLQDWVRNSLITILGLDPQDVKPAIMGERGVDVKLASTAISSFPYSIECKNAERLNIWAAFEQAIANSLCNTQPILFISKNHKTPLVVVDAEYFINMVKKNNENRKDSKCP